SQCALPWRSLPPSFESDLRKSFVARYEQLYGRGSALAGATLEIVVCRLRARAPMPRPRLFRSGRSSRNIPAAAVRKKRDIYWPDLKKRRATPVYDGELLVNGNRIKGPAIGENAVTARGVLP